MSQKFGLLGRVTGAPVGVDPDPNTTPPTRAVVLGDRQQIKRGALSVIAQAACTVRVWIYDDDAAAWIPLTIATACPATAPLVFDGAAFAGAKTFVQVTANGGGATYVGFQYI